MAALAVGAGASGLAVAQQVPETQRGPYFGPLPAPSPAERIGRDLVRIGTIVVDTAKKELSVAGVINDVQVLEFLANTKGGWKAYESAMEMDTNAVNFNVACLLIGLDTEGVVLSRYQFDPEPPKGQPVDLFVEWDDNGKPRRARAEQLIYHRPTKETLSDGPWVYTGSVFQQKTLYMAETDGVLIGFMHSPSPIIENPRRMPGQWGDIGINPELGLKAGTPVKLIVRALPRTAQ